MYQLHKKLYTSYNYIEIEEMRKEFGEKDCSREYCCLLYTSRCV